MKFQTFQYLLLFLLAVPFVSSGPALAKKEAQLSASQIFYVTTDYSPLQIPE
jgi:hypothetical protein